MVSIINERMVDGPHLPLYVLQELIGIQLGKGDKNIWFGRLEGSRLILGLFSAIMKKIGNSFGM